jgi:hypothetical protein
MVYKLLERIGERNIHCRHKQHTTTFAKNWQDEEIVIWLTFIARGVVATQDDERKCEWVAPAPLPAGDVPFASMTLDHAG